jgi:hypothetical protein
MRYDKVPIENSFETVPEGSRGERAADANSAQASIRTANRIAAFLMMGPASSVSEISEHAEQKRIMKTIAGERKTNQSMKMLTATEKGRRLA